MVKRKPDKRNRALSPLYVKKGTLVDVTGKKIVLKGVNLGGWLMPEGYILHAPNLGVYRFRQAFRKRLGSEALALCEHMFRDTFITAPDFARIAAWGANCVRLPFHYRLIESRPFTYNAGGLNYLDVALGWAQSAGLWVILDLHATPGAQNKDWHSDSTGIAGLWQNKKYQERTVELWRFLADRYKDRSVIAGFDLVNEPVPPRGFSNLNGFYRRIIKAIRESDKNHIIFLEGINWAQDIERLIRPDDDHIAYNIHNYQPLDFTFNFVPGLRYPGIIQGQRWNKSLIKKNIAYYVRICQQRKVPLLVGEFGVNYRCAHCFGELDWLKDSLSVFGEYGIHWTYWTYKAVAGGVFPDGIYQYLDNPPWICREGPVRGWDMWSSLWKKKKRDIVSSWRTTAYHLNESLVQILRNNL